LSVVSITQHDVTMQPACQKLKFLNRI